VSGDSGVEEVYRPRISTYKVDQHFGGARHPNLNFWRPHNRTPTVAALLPITMTSISQRPCKILLHGSYGFVETALIHNNEVDVDNCNLIVIWTYLCHD